ncbi:hypothetical protein [Streptomyces sp. NBC_01236]|uniref:hypothetical protein n=1 Tax=Streptomyces sp. NBC_01236 TaxID=2903789 RepID=UPI002E11A740|nr:hypothetical protein OG324_50370 [Streptomyces sp. NBC_01236]
MGPKPCAERGPQPVGPLSDLLRIDRAGQRPYDRHHAEAGQAHLRRERPRKRRPRWLRAAAALRSHRRVRRQLCLVVALTERGEQLGEPSQLQPLTAQPLTDLLHGFHSTVHAVVEIRRGRSLLTGNLFPLLYQRGLAHTGVAAHMEEKLIVVSLGIPAKILPERSQLTPSAHEPTPAPTSCQLLP